MNESIQDTSSPDSRGSDTATARRLVRAAQAHIAQRGVRRLDIRGLASEAKTSTSAFHRAFGSEEALLAEVFTAGWRIVEEHIAVRSVGTLGDLGDLIEALLQALFDAIESSPQEVGATIIIGMTTLGESRRDTIRNAEGHRRFRALSAPLLGLFSSRLPPAEAAEAAEIVFGAVMRRLFLLTPLCVAPSDHAPFDRAAFIRVMRRMIDGTLEAKQ